MQDTDGDGLTDYEELMVYHTNALLQKTNPNQPYTDYYTVDQTDSDGDQIPDRIELWYAQQSFGMNAGDPNDAKGDLDGDGYSNLQAYRNGWSFVAHLNQYDNDADGIFDVIEDAWSAAYPNILSNSNFNDAVEDFDNDGLMNYEEIALGLNPGVANSRSNAVPDLLEWSWRQNLNQNAAWQVMDDNDHDGVMDGLMAFVTAFNAGSTGLTLPVRASSADYDGDGMPDVWEYRYHLNLRDAADANANNDGDSLTNVLEYPQDRDPLVSDDPPPPALTLSGGAGDGEVGTAYSATFTASGGNGSYSYSVNGTLPDGLTLDSSSGAISGTPSNGGTFDFYVQVSDSALQTASLSCQVVIAGLAISTTTLAHGVVGSAYSAAITAVRGTAPYTFSVLADAADTGLPFGYTLQSNGTLSSSGENSTGSLAAGSYTFTAQVSDNAGRTAARQLTLVVEAAPPTPLRFATLALPVANPGLPYAAQLSAAGGSGGYSFTPAGLPEWLNLSGVGVLSGTPPAAGSATVGAQVMDSEGSVSGASYLLTVSPPQMEIVSGENQVMFEGEPAQPLVVRVCNGAVPVPGVGVSFASHDFMDADGSTPWNVTVFTGLDGTASVLPGNSVTFGAALVTATVAGGAPQVTFHLSSTISPYGIVGGPDDPLVNQADATYPVNLSFNNTPRPPSKPPVNPNGSDLSDDAVEVQVRWVACSEVTDLKLKYSKGYRSKQGGVTTEHPVWGFDAALPGQQGRWQASKDGVDDAEAGEEALSTTALTIADAEWRPMKKGEELSGFDYHDSGSQWQVLPEGLPQNLQTLIGFIGGGGAAATVINSVPYAFWMASYAQLKDHRTLQVRLKRKPGHEVDAEHPGAEIKRVFLLATRANGTHTGAEPMTLTLSPTENETATEEVVKLDPQAQQNRVRVEERLVPFELAPQVLAVNTNFDERKLKDGFAKPDAEDTTLQAISGPNAGKIVTTDLHEGFFGLQPGALPYTETEGAVVKIKKIDKNDPVTGAKQTGHVRMYRIWGDTDAQVLPVELYTPDSLVANDIGPTLYAADPNMPVRYYIEGVKPGKITLEFSYQKGATSFTNEQEFLVCTQKSRADWLAEITDQIKLETGGTVDMSTYNTTDSFNTQRAQIQQVYRFYEGLHRRKPNVQRWGGLAKRAACPVYAGLSDAQWGQEASWVLVPSGLGGIGLVSLSFFQNVLIHGGHNIFFDLGWQCRAYERSGFYALKHVKDKKLNGGAIREVELDPWLAINKGETENNIASILMGTRSLAHREQEFIVQPAWDRITALPTSTVDSLFSWLSDNPLPGEAGFYTGYPGKNIVLFDDRWPWVETNMLPQWGSMAEPARNSLVNDPLVNAAVGYSRMSKYFSLPIKQ